MVGLLGAIGGGALGGAAVSIVINAVDKFSRTFAAANASLLKLGGAITAVGIAGAFAVGGLIRVAGQFEQTQIAFSTMLGSAEDAQDMLKDLAAFAKKTPFTITGVEKTAKMLLAMSIEVDDMLPTLKSLGDVASGLSVPMERLALNFGQVKVQGKLTGRELRDFSIAGVPLVAELAKNLNVSEQQIKEMVSAGDIGFAEVEDAFTSMTSEGGKFFDLMDAQSKTLLGQISNIKDSFITISRVMGNVFLPAAKVVIKHIAAIVAWFEEHPKILVFTAAILGITAALALIVGPILILLGLMPLMIAGFATLTGVALPWILAIGAIVIALGALIIIYQKVKDNHDAFIVGLSSKFAQFNKFMIDKLFGLKIVFAKIWNGIANIILKVWNFIVTTIESKINDVINLINKLIRGLNKLPFVNISEISNISLGRAKAQLRDIDAIVGAIEAERDAIKNNIDLQHQELIANAAILKNARDKVDEIGEQNNALLEQTELVKKLAGFKVIAIRDPKTGKTTFGDIFNPRSFITQSKDSPLGEFQTKFAAEQASLGGGVTINIENIQGLDPDEIAEALQDKLKQMIVT